MRRTSRSDQGNHVRGHGMAAQQYVALTGFPSVGVVYLPSPLASEANEPRGEEHDHAPNHAHHGEHHEERGNAIVFTVCHAFGNEKPWRGIAAHCAAVMNIRASLIGGTSMSRRRPCTLPHH